MLICVGLLGKSGASSVSIPFGHVLSKLCAWSDCTATATAAPHVRVTTLIPPLITARATEGRAIPRTAGLCAVAVSEALWLRVSGSCVSVASTDSVIVVAQDPTPPDRIETTSTPNRPRGASALRIGSFISVVWSVAEITTMRSHERKTSRFPPPRPLPPSAEDKVPPSMMPSNSLSPSCTGPSIVAVVLVQFVKSNKDRSGNDDADPPPPPPIPKILECSNEKVELETSGFVSGGKYEIVLKRNSL